MPSSGPLYPGTAASLANAGSSENAEAWVTPSNIGADDGTEATITAATYDSPDISQLLVASNFGFAIPTGATIDGIVVEIDRRNSAGAASDNRVQLAKGTTFAALVGTNKADTATDWPTTTGAVSYGTGTTDLWGTTWTPAEINDAGFAVMLSAQADAANTDVQVDYIRVTVHYTAGAGPSTISPSAITSGEAFGSLNRAIPLAPVFQDDFETGDTSKWTTVTPSVGTIEVITGAKRNAAYGLHISQPASSVGGTRIQKEFRSTDEIFISGWFYQDTDGAAGNNNAWARVFSGTQRLFDVYRQNSTGEIYLRITSTGTATYAFRQLLAGVQPIDTWYFIEIYVKYNGAGAVSTVTAWIDGTQRYSSTTETIFAGQFDRLQHGAEHNNQYVDIWVDDVSVLLPPVASSTIAPSAIGSGEAFGSPTLVPGGVTVQASAIASSEAIGSHTLSVVGGISKYLIEDASGYYLLEDGVSDLLIEDNFVTPSNQTILPSFIQTAEVVGGATFIGPRYIAAVGIPTDESFGDFTIAPGAVAITPAAIEAPGGAGGIVAQDSFTTGTSGNLSTHTAETGGTWFQSWVEPGYDRVINIDAATDRATLDQSSTGDIAIKDVAYALDGVLLGDGYVQAHLYADASLGSSWLVARQDPTNADTFYFAKYLGSTLMLFRNTNYSYVQIASNAASGTGEWVRLEVTGTSPTTIKVYRESTQGALDSAAPYINTTDNTAANQVASGWVGIAGEYDDDFIDWTGDIDDFLAVSTSASAVGTPTLANTPPARTIAPTAIASGEAVSSSVILPGNANIIPSAITSGEALGALVLRATATILPSAIATAETFGTASLLPGGTIILPGAIASGEILGSPTVQSSGGPRVIAPTAIASSEAVGTHSILPGGVTVAPSGITSAEASGFPGLGASATILPTGIASGESISSPTLRASIAIRPSAISSGESLGTPAIRPGGVAIVLTGIASAESLGNPILAQAGGPRFIAPAGISSAEAVGAASLLPGNANIRPVAVNSDESFGSQSVRPGAVSIGPTSIGAGEILGTPGIDPGTVQITPQGVGSGEAAGSPTLHSTSRIVVTGISTGELLGLPVLEVASIGSTIELVGISTGELLGLPSLIPGETFIQPSSVPAAEQVGALTLTGSRAGWQWVNRSRNMTGVHESGFPVLQDGFAVTRKKEGEG